MRVVMLGAELVRLASPRNLYWKSRMSFLSLIWMKPLMFLGPQGPCSYIVLYGNPLGPSVSTI